MSFYSYDGLIYKLTINQVYHKIVIFKKINIYILNNRFSLDLILQLRNQEQKPGGQQDSNRYFYKKSLLSINSIFLVPANRYEFCIKQYFQTCFLSTYYMHILKKIKQSIHKTIFRLVLANKKSIRIKYFLACLKVSFALTILQNIKAELLISI